MKLLSVKELNALMPKVEWVDDVNQYIRKFRTYHGVIIDVRNNVITIPNNIDALQAYMNIKSLRRTNEYARTRDFANVFNVRYEQVADTEYYTAVAVKNTRDYGNWTIKEPSNDKT